MAGQDYYADLQLTPYATAAQIKSAFHTLAKQCHPDKSGNNDTAAFRRVHEAYETLSDPETRAAYDRNYPRARTHYQAYDESSNTRTAAYEAEEAEREREARYKRSAPPPPAPRNRSPPPQNRSPPPYKPVRGPIESGFSYYFGKAYKAWEKRDAAYRQRHPDYDAENQPPTPTGYFAHGLSISMSSHPSATQNCTMRTPDWNKQLAGSDVCVFCLKSTTNCSRCPGCQALACQTCLSGIVRKERSSAFRGFDLKTQYVPSGG